jgi:hypothetical protein
VVSSPATLIGIESELAKDSVRLRESTDILHLPARVVVTAADCLTWGDARDVLEELSRVSEMPMIIP